MKVTQAYEESSPISFAFSCFVAFTLFVYLLCFQRRVRSYQCLKLTTPGILSSLICLYPCRILYSMALKSFRLTWEACRRNSYLTWAVLLLSPSANRNLQNEGSMAFIGLELLLVVVMSGVAAVSRSFLLASRSNVRYNAKTSFCIPDFAPMICSSSRIA